MLPDPWWPVVVLAVIQVVDGFLCLGKAGFVTECLDAVGLPASWRWLLPTVKFAAAGGLLVGLVVPYLAFAATVGLVVYFVLAVAAHVRARDLGRNLFLNATGMLVLCAGGLAISFA